MAIEPSTMQPNEPTDYSQLAERLAKLEATFGATTERIALVDKLDKLSDRIYKLEDEHNSWKTLAKYLSITFTVVGAIVSVLLAILSVFGYKSLDSTLRSKVDERFSFYSDLGAGLAYVSNFPER